MKTNIDASKIPIPTGWRLLIKKHTAKTMTSGGIALPEDTVKGQDYVGNIGTVVDMGQDAYQHEKFGDGEPWCEIGDTIFFNPHSGMDIKIRDGEAIVTYRLINDDEVLGTIEDPEVVVRYDI